MYWKTGGAYAVREGSWKLITNSAGENAQLYNITEDPYEKQNLADVHPDKTARLNHLLLEHRKNDNTR